MQKTDPTPALTAAWSEADLSSIIGMAWSDDTPFEAIALQFGLREGEVVALMRDQLKTRSFRVWRMRVRGRSAKHEAKQRHQLPMRSHPSPAVSMADVDERSNQEFPTRASELNRHSLS
jgi:uncharacterized protein (TIGR03643 family)